jgi:putative ABC transport system substrate-binding protein
MKRREFITLLGGGYAAWPLAVRAQHATKLPAIGFLVSGAPSSHGQWVAAFVQRLRELQWIEGRTVAIEYRWAGGNTAGLDEMAAEFVRLKVDVIVTTGTPATAAAKRTTSEDIASVFDTLRDRGDALYVATDPLILTNRIRINTLALGVRSLRCTGLGSTSKWEA